MFHYILLVLPLFFAARLILSFLSTRRHAAKARALGCSTLPCFPQAWYDPFNINGVRKVFAGAKRGRILDVFQDRFDYMSRLKGRYCTTYDIHMLGASTIVTRHPENLKAILATQFDDFVLGSRVPIAKPLLGNGIFASDGKTWEHSRSMLRPSFVRERVSDLELEDRHNHNLHRALPVDLSDGWTTEIDLQPLFFRLTIDSSTEFLFGQSVGSQLASLPDAPQNHIGESAKGFDYNFDRAQDYIGKRLRLNNLYWLINPREFRRTVKACHDFIDHYVDVALNQPSSAVEKSSGTSKAQYIFLDELAQKVRDPVVLRYELLNILLAGRDTTASLLGWLFLQLSRNPAIYAKLRSAILSSFGSRTSPKEVTFHSLKECSYLQYCMNEALRLHPVVPLNARTAARDTTLPSGGGPQGTDPVYVKKGQQVAYSVYVMHRSKELWGEDAEVFLPERWEGRRHGWEYLPFNGGPRICLGQQFALTSAGYCTMRLVQRFDQLDNCELDPVIRYNQSLTSHSRNGVKVRLHEAAE